MESQAKIISEKRRSFFESNSKNEKPDAMDVDSKNSRLTEDDRALLKVFFVFEIDVVLLNNL